MQNLVKKNNKDNFTKLHASPKLLTFQEIEEFYNKKNHADLRIGLEYERICLDKKTLKSAPCDTVSKIVEHFSSIMHWKVVFDNKVTVGAIAPDSTSLSIEPGGQLEISIAPKSTVLDIDLELSKIIELLDKIAKIYDVVFLGYGITPLSSADRIDILEKRRYKVMNDYLPYCSYGELCTTMMRKTAGIQVNIDFKNTVDAYKKLKFFNLIMPVISALFANSPIENDILTDKKTNRAYAWLYTGQNRCNCFYKNVFKGLFNKKTNLFKNYIKEVINVPMVYIERENNIIPIKGKINFAQFMKNGFEDFTATIDDYILHQSLCFPDVRLKNYIEIRNHDSQDYKTTLALCAFYKGLSNADFSYLLNKFSYLNINKIELYQYEMIKSGLKHYLTHNKSGWDIVNQLFEISKNNLSAQERIYLKPIANMIKARRTNADLIQEFGVRSALDLVNFLL